MSSQQRNNQRSNGSGRGGKSTRSTRESNVQQCSEVYVPVFMPRAGGVIPPLPQGATALIYLEGAIPPIMPPNGRILPMVYATPVGAQAIQASQHRVAPYVTSGPRSSNTREDKPKKSEQASIEAKKALEEHQKSVENAKSLNVINHTIGKVTCALIPYKHSKSHNKWPKKIGYKNIDVTGGNMKTVVPHNLGPVAYPVINSTGRFLPAAKNFHNFWQAAKLYDYEILVPEGLPKPGEEGFVMRPEYISAAYWTERERLHNEEKPTRKVKLDLKQGDPKPKVMYSIFDNTLQDKLTARMYYCSIYSALVQATEGFLKLKAMEAEGYNIQIVGHNGRDLSELDGVHDNNSLYIKWLSYFKT